LPDILKLSTLKKKNGKNQVVGVIFIATLFISLSTAYGDTIYMDSGNTINNEKLMVLVASDNSTLFLPVVIKNSPEPPVGIGVWDSSTWDNGTWGNWKCKRLPGFCQTNIAPLIFGRIKMRYLKKARSTVGWILVVLIAISVKSAINACAEDIINFTFTPGTTISADQVNQNFKALNNAMPRTNGAVGNNATLTSSYQNIAILTVTPSDSGTLLLLGNANVTLTQGSTAGGSGWGTSDATICITQTSGGGAPGHCDLVMLDAPSSLHGDPVPPYSPRLKVPVTIVGSAPVTKGTPVTFYLTAAKDASSVGSSTISGSGLNAIFIRPGLQ
jgi:hypothetical protein